MLNGKDVQETLNLIKNKNEGGERREEKSRKREGQGGGEREGREREGDRGGDEVNLQPARCSKDTCTAGALPRHGSHGTPSTDMAAFQKHQIFSVLVSQDYVTFSRVDASLFRQHRDKITPPKEQRSLVRGLTKH